MQDILKLARIQIYLTIVFLFFKLIRPSVVQRASPEFLKIMVLSLPNFFQAVTGVFVLTGLGLLINDKFNKKYAISPTIIYLSAVILAGIFVITQELNIYNLRGNNTSDPNDIIFSCIGLVVAYGMVWYIQPRIYNNN